MLFPANILALVFWFALTMKLFHRAIWMHRRFSDTFNIRYHTPRGEANRTITLAYHSNEKYCFLVNGKELFKTMRDHFTLQDVPPGHCIAIWDAAGDLIIVAQRALSGILVPRLTKDDNVILDSTEINTMLLYWSKHKCRLEDDPGFQHPLLLTAPIHC
ncbi:unnamed protein product [Rhizoctonia solani]|uniref:Uncharacterized protein n=1 Tax=Rhizoctonia solani TaxID=456999 RepID=A0A8H3ARY4_9AGAM|nr:unnamed protein product [Rhizoctonia solani]CAE6498985.1 unnamed protein product [Rhizoctonia solani]